MGNISRQEPVALIASIIFREDKICGEAEKKLCGLFGSKNPLEKTLPFDYTDYYAEEMGENLKRKLICFEKLIKKDEIYKTKIRTNRIERAFTERGKRKINVDPGYVTEAKLVLLTTKDYTHRVHVQKGIFAESTLYFHDGTFKPWPWTYPDYASSQMKDYFEKVREIYIKKRRERDGKCS